MLASLRHSARRSVAVLGAATLLLGDTAHAADPPRKSARWMHESRDPHGRARQRELADLPQIDGATGLLRTQHASGAAPAQLRLQLLGFALRSAWLCDASCAAGRSHALSQHGARLALGVGISRNLEAFAASGLRSTSAEALLPRALMARDDSRLGLKLHAALPRRTLRLGASAAALLPAADGESVSAFSALGGELSLLLSYDARERTRPWPLRLSFNAGYTLDRRARLQQRGTALASRAERVALGASGGDALHARLGAELMLWQQRLRPFAELGLDALLHDRTSFEHGARCDVAPADRCLRGALWPLMRTSFGLRSTQLPAGLSATLALDLGLLGVQRYAQAAVPEAPWRVWFGLGWNLDPRPPQPARIVTTTTSEDGHGVLSGVVLDAQTRAPLPQAVLEFLNESAQNPLASADDGRFFSDGLRPGPQRLRVSKPGYFTAECTLLAQVPAAGEAQLGECPLRVRPNASSVRLRLRTTAELPLAFAEVRALRHGTAQRTLSDESGRAQLDQLPSGPLQIAVYAADHQPLRLQLEIAPGSQHELQLQLAAQRGAAHFALQGDTLRASEPWRWPASSEQVPEALNQALYELAAWLRDHPELARLELRWQSLSRNESRAARAQRQRQVEALRSWLIQHGAIATERLSARALPAEPRPRAPRDAAQLTLQILERSVPPVPTEQK